MAYKGAKWIGIYPIKDKNNKIIKSGDIIDMPEDEAKIRRGFEPVYDIKQQVKKAKEEYDG